MAAAVDSNSNNAGGRRQAPANEFTLTSSNPFQEDDELDNSSYAYVSSLFSKMRNTFAPAPTVSKSTPAPASALVATQPLNVSGGNSVPVASSSTGAASDVHPRMMERKSSLSLKTKAPAPPLVSVTPVRAETPTIADSPVSRTGLFGFTAADTPEGPYGTAIPGFPIADDARSIKTSTSVGHKRGASVSKVIRRLRGEGLSKDYWMDDENCKECYDCKSVFTAWRRKHHCRICGQIFCARCASNIIKGSRFGQDSMIRICNICLKTLEDDTAIEEDDDARSVLSSSTSIHPSHVHQHRQSLETLPASPFAASQIFKRVEEPFNLFSIAEAKPSLSSAPTSRSQTPGEVIQPSWEGEVPVKPVPAPFRRQMADEEADSVALEASMNAATESFNTPGNDSVVFPTSGDNGPSSIVFPGGSPELGADRPGWPRGRTESDADPLQTPFMRSRAQSRLADLGLLAGEAGWRTRRESTAYANEVNSASMFHIRLMLKQMLTTENLPNMKEWEETLLKLAMQIARDLVLATGRREIDMDVRRFVKIKRIPGGKPRDSEYIDGAVITKNFAHKRMPRQLSNPRIVFVTFPFDYHRVEGQFISFDPLVAQEDEYLKNLVSRVAALRPHILLVEKMVSRKALDYLHKANIAVARNVKFPAIQHVSRMTQGDIISSMDRLATDPKLGHCAKFKIQTFEHPLIPGKRKTYMRFEGCNRDLGCTIVLRGGDITVLTKVKKVTRFLAFLVRNLKMETYLWKDSVVTMPPLSRYAVPSPPAQFSGNPVNAMNSSGGGNMSISTGNLMIHLSPLENIESMQAIESIDENELPEEDVQQLRLSKRIQQSIEPYYTTFISVSATLRFPPPYPILRMKQLDDRLREIKRAWEDEVVRREEGALTSKPQQELTLTLAPPTLPEIVATPSSTPLIHEEAPSYFERHPTPSLTQSSIKSFDTSLSTASILTDSNPVNLKGVSDIALESELALIRHEHSHALAAWEWYLRRNKDDFVVEKYQRIAYRTYTVPFADVDVQMPCFMPMINYVNYYGNNDCALGTFIEESCIKYLNMKPGTLCTGGGANGGKGCGKPKVGHCHVFVHNQTRLLVATEPWDGKIAGGDAAGIPADYLTTWSVCRLCGKFTPFIPVSLETQQYSFAKFLELHFYPADVMLMQGAGCVHNIYQHHVRYFAWKGLTVRFQSDPIVLFEPVFPSQNVFIRPDVPLQLKNHDYEHLLKRNATFWNSVEQRLKWYDGLYANTFSERYPMETDIAFSVTRALLAKANAAKSRITQAIHSAYSSTFVTDTLAFGKIRQELQDESTVWEKEFEKLDELRRPPPPTFFDKDIRKSVAIPSRLVKGMFGGTTPPPGSPEKRPIMAESELESELSSFHGDTEELDEKKSRSATPGLEKAPSLPVSKDTDIGEDSDSTINAVHPTSKQSSSADLRTTEVNEAPATEENEGERPIVRSPIEIVISTASPPPEDGVDEATPSGLAPLSNALRSRLPRRVKHSPRIAHLVQQFQTGETDPLPFGTTQSGGMSESDQEIEPPLPVRSRPKTRPLQPTDDAPLSDFEGSYAANVAPMYFAHRRPAGHTSRIPGPIMSGSEGPSRKASPERGPNGRTIRFGQGFRSFPAPDATKGKGRGKGNVSNLSLTARKSHGRANTYGPGNKVSRLTKQWEQFGRENEKSRRSQATRNRRARPVATARVTVEVLKTVKEGFQDASESSSSSSEADDEDEDEEPQPRSRPRSLDKEESREERAMNELTPVVDLASSTEELPTDTQAKSVSEPDTKSSTSQPEASVPLPTPEVPSIRKEPPSPPLDSQKGLERVATLPNLSETEPERSSVFRALSMLGGWNARPTEKGPDVIYPGSKVEHFFRESTIVVREDEPTSFIAFALDSLQHRDYLANRKRALGRPSVSNDSKHLGTDDGSLAESGSNWELISVDALTPKDLLKDEGSALETRGTSPSFTFTTDNFQARCIVYLTEQFDALRSICRCEKDFLRSLSRCVKWDTGGGKSGSAFLKTRDDRFIAKEISRFEGDAFGEIGPAYFSYLSQAFSTNRPTLLAKIFGLYTIEYRRISTEKKGEEYIINGGKSEKTVRMNFLVMENLFHGRRFSKIYDLKGSVRGRHVNSTGKANEVLLDENLVQMTHAAPIYLREHGKRMLRGALFNDTNFLQSVNVMDYSLLVGVDDQSNELVLGIVDYIRTFTWDKRLESIVKDFGGTKEGPTIVFPKQYKQRFRSAMERYFPLVPDRWMKQEDVPDDEGKDLLQLWPDW